VHTSKRLEDHNIEQSDGSGERKGEDTYTRRLNRGTLVGGAGRGNGAQVEDDRCSYRKYTMPSRDDNFTYRYWYIILPVDRIRVRNQVPNCYLVISEIQ